MTLLPYSYSYYHTNMIELHECNLQEGQKRYIIVKTIAPLQQRHKYMIYHYIVWVAAQRLSSKEMEAIKWLREGQAGALCKLEKTLLTPHCRHFSSK